jgi:hypothetical protein
MGFRHFLQPVTSIVFDHRSAACQATQNRNNDMFRIRLHFTGTKKYFVPKGKANL